MTYFIIINNQQTGPYTLEELFDRHITSDTLVWTEGMTNWTPAWQIEELHDILKGIDPRTASSQQASGQQQTQKPTPPPYPNQPASQNTNKQETDLKNTLNHQKEKKDKSKVFLYSVIAFMIILIILAITAPNKDSHEQAINKEMMEAINQKTDDVSNDGIMAEGFKMLNSMITNNVLNGVLDQVLEYHNYIIFSKTTVNFNDEDYTVSWGILGHVFTMNANSILKAIDKESPAVDTTQQQDEDNSNRNTSMKNSQDTDNIDKSTSNIDKKIDQTVSKVSDHVENKIKQKVDQKLDQAADSSTIKKVVDKILNLL